MTNHAVLAGSVLAAVALWAAVYTALLPERTSTRSAAGEVSAARSVSPADLAQEAPGPARWVDLPREQPEPAVTSLDAEKLSAADLPDAKNPRRDHRISRLHRIRRAALPGVLVERDFVRERAFARRRVRAPMPMRLRRMREPIQFSLATRSSS